MNNYAENDTFSFGGNDDMFSPNYDGTMNKDNLQNGELFNNEVSNSIIDNSIQLSENLNNPLATNEDIFALPANPFVAPESQKVLEDSKESIANVENENNPLATNEDVFALPANSFVVPESQKVLEDSKESIANVENANQPGLYMQLPNDNSNELVNENISHDVRNLQQEVQINPTLEMNLNRNNEVLNESIAPQTEENQSSVEYSMVAPQQDVTKNIINLNESLNTTPDFAGSDVQFTNTPVGLEISNLNKTFDSSNDFAKEPIYSLTNELEENSGTTSNETQTIVPEQDYQNDLKEQIEVDNDEKNIPSLEPETISMSNSNLNDLTEFKEEENVKTTDIKSLFDRVGINVREASDIFKRNTEMKEKIDSRFEELKKLQSEVSKVKKAQYDEINAYKEDVLSKLTSKKDEIESRLNKLKEFQKSLEKEKTDFEQYRKSQKEEIERIQKEVQDAYDNRREELKRIEDILRKQKDSLDEERNQLNLDKIQYESDKNELANNLLKFNEIVDSFTNGIDKIERE